MAQAPRNISVSIDYTPLTEALEVLRDASERMSIWSDVTAELSRARAKHGTQHDIPMGTGPAESYALLLDNAAVNLDFYDEEDHTLDCLNNRQLEECAKFVEQTTGDSWVKILGEEFFEAAATDDPDDLDAELVQTIAMGVSMLQAHRRQQAAS